MNGWQRLGVVVSLIIGVPAAALMYEGAASSSGYVYPKDAQLAGLTDQKRLLRVWQIALNGDPKRYQNCEKSTVRISGPGTYSKEWYITCNNTEWAAWGAAFKGLALAFGSVFMIGGIIGWVIEGFRKPK